MSAVPSLQSMSMVKVAVSICNGEALKEYILGLSSLGNGEPGCMKEKKVRTAIETLNVPKSLLDPLANQTLLVAFGMSKWRRFLNGHFHLDARYCTSVLGSSTFLWNGKIDKMKLAEKLVKDEKLDFSERFKIACFYWLEDFIVSLWSRQMTVEQRRAFTETCYWPYSPHESLAIKVACELEKGGGLVFSDRVVVRKVIKFATAAGSEVAVQHLWSQLDPAEDEEMAEAMISEFPRWIDFCRTEEFADILCFLLPKLTEHRRWMFNFEGRRNNDGFHRILFEMLLSTNRIHAIWDLMNISMQYMHGATFVTSLERISLTFCNPDTTCQRMCCDDYRELVKKIWTQSPVHLKKYAITKKYTRLWETLLCSTEKTRDIFAFFLEDVTHEEKLDMIFSNGGKQGLICLGFCRDHRVSDFLLQLLNLSQDEKRQLLKREILLHDPLTCNFDFGSVARYCLQFKDDDTKAEFKRKLVGHRIEKICVHYILSGDHWTDLDSLLCWYFSTAEEIGQFKATLWESSGPDICQRLHYNRRSMQDCYAWFGLDPNEIHELGDWDF